MLAVIVGTHGHFAEELVKTCEMICGSVSNVKAVTLVPGESADEVVGKYEAALSEMEIDDGVIFLNDLFGGSPYNAACRVAMGKEDFGIVTGVNLPMLIEMVGAQMVGEKVEIKALMEKAIEAGKSGMQSFHTSLINQDNDEEDL